MIIVKGDNLREVIADINHCLRGNGAHKDVSARAKVPCCTNAEVVFIGGLTITGETVDGCRAKHLHACKNCGQIHKDEAGEIVQVYGTVSEYFDSLLAKHGEFGISLGTKAQAMGIPLACR